MRKSLITAALAATFVAGAALAADQSDTGAIKTIDQAKHQLTLADGKVFQLPTAWESTGFKAGDKVKVTYEMKGSQMVASAVTHAS
jgi:hypothetical protein